MGIVEKHCGMSKVKARNLTKDKLSLAVEVRTGEGGRLVEELTELEIHAESELFSRAEQFLKNRKIPWC